MKKLFLILIIPTVLLLCGCSAAIKPLEYQSSAANAEIIISTEDGFSARALLSLGKFLPDGFPRDAKITFLAPESLAGIVVTRSDGEVCVSLGSLSLPADSVGGFIGIVDLFSIEGTLSSAEICSLGGKKATLVKIADPDTFYEVYISENGLPLRIVGNGFTVDVVWYECLQQTSPSSDK